MNIRDGRGSRFWEDKWCSMTPLRIFFPELHRAAKDPWDWSKITGKDMVGFLRCHGNQKNLLPQIEEVLNVLPDTFPPEGGEIDLHESRVLNVNYQLRMLT